jgi:hypothetical protein
MKVPKGDLKARATSGQKGKNTRLTLAFAQVELPHAYTSSGLVAQGFSPFNNEYISFIDHETSLVDLLAYVQANRVPLCVDSKVVSASVLVLIILDGAALEATLHARHAISGSSSGACEDDSLIRVGWTDARKACPLHERMLTRAECVDPATPGGDIFKITALVADFPALRFGSVLVDLSHIQWCTDHSATILSRNLLDLTQDVLDAEAWASCCKEVLVDANMVGSYGKKEGVMLSYQYVTLRRLMFGDPRTKSMRKGGTHDVTGAEKFALLLQSMGPPRAVIQVGTSNHVEACEELHPLASMWQCFFGLQYLRVSPPARLQQWFSPYSGVIRCMRALFRQLKFKLWLFAGIRSTVSCLLDASLSLRWSRSPMRPGTGRWQP